MSSVLLLDTNVASAPIYHFLVAAGFQVFVAGLNPRDYLAKTAKHYIPLDYSDLHATRDCIASLKIDALVPGCNDVSYQVCAELGRGLHNTGLDSPDVADTINNKEKFRAFAQRVGLPVPQLVTPEQAMDAASCAWPLIVKPVDAFSGRGMSIIQQGMQHTLPVAMAHAKSFSRSKTCLLEHYVSGQLYSHSAFIVNREIKQDFVVEEHGSANPFVVDTSRVVFDFHATTLARIRACIGQMAQELQLVDGLVHTQFILQNDVFWLIEITRRCPGDLYSYLIERTTGFAYSAAYARPFVGLRNEFHLPLSEPAHVMRHTITLPAEGTLESLRFNQPLWIDKLWPLALAGDTIAASPFGRIGLLFAKAQSKQELAQLFETTLKRGLYTTQSHAEPV